MKEQINMLSDIINMYLNIVAHNKSAAEAEHAFILSVAPFLLPEKIDGVKTIITQEIERQEQIHTQRAIILAKLKEYK